MEGNELDFIRGFIYGGLGAFGGLMFYIYKVKEGKSFSFSDLMITLALSFFVGYITGNYIDGQLTGKNKAKIALSGFLSHYILIALEKKGKSLNFNNKKDDTNI